MDKNDRAMIDRCVDFLAPKINMVKLWPKLVEKRVFNPDDVNASKWEKNLAAEETARDILLTIKTRGPDAFVNLALCLRQLQYHTLADVLQGYRPLDNNEQLSQPEQRNDSDDSADDVPVKDDYHKSLSVDLEPLKIKVRKAKKFLDNRGYGHVGRYRMRSRPRGYVLLITIKESTQGIPRLGAERDEGCLKTLFQEMGFEVTSRPNLTGQQILELVENFSKKDFRLVDSCFVIISAHGHATVNEKGVMDTELAGADYDSQGSKKVLCNDIVNFFTAKSCPSLVGKPKIFVFQMCRGENHHEVIRTVTDGIDSNAPLRNYSDIMIAHSTMYGFVSYRDNVNGSWFIQILCEVFMNYAHILHVQELFQMVDRRLAQQDCRGQGQTSTLKLLGFNKHCYLNPGLFED